MVTHYVSWQKPALFCMDFGVGQRDYTSGKVTDEALGAPYKI